MNKRPISEETKKKALYMAGKIIENHANATGKNHSMLMIAGMMKVITADMYAMFADAVIYTPAELCRMNARRAGNRICQDWHYEDPERPDLFFDKKERDDLGYNHQIENSMLADYDEGSDFFHDEMSVSFTIADFLDDLALGRFPVAADP